jgi:hypothetical protein
LGIEIRGDDQKHSSFGMFRGDGGKHILIDIAGDEFAQLTVSEQACTKQRVEHIRRFEQALSDAAGVDLPKLPVVTGSEERKRRDQRTGADAGDDGYSGRVPAADQPFRIPAP